MDYSFWFRLLLFRSPLLQESSFLSFPAGTKMFQFPAFPSHTLLYSCMDNQTFTLVEFPHSDIYGSMDICSSPQLFAAYHVLLRLLVPRYSPYALSSLTFLLRINFVILRQISSKIVRCTNVLSRSFSSFSSSNSFLLCNISVNLRLLISNF